MFKVLIAESDKENRKRIREYINASTLGFKVYAEAENGRQVLDTLEKEQIDLVITELRLPLVSGYQLLKKLEHSYPLTRMIMYAGYNELEVLQKAEEEGLLAHMLKPVKPQEVDRVLISAAQSLEELARKNNEEKKIIYRYEQMLPIFQDRFFINLVHGHLEDDRDILAGFEYFKLSLKPEYTVMIVKIDYFDKLALVFDEREKELFIFTVVSKIQKRLNEIKNGVAFINSYDEVALILGDGLEIYESLKIAEDIKQLVKHETVTTVTVGIGMTCSRESEIYVSYKQAKAALRYNYRIGSDAVIHIGFVEPKNKLTYKYPKNKEELLVYQTVIGNRTAAMEILHELRSSISSSGKLPEKLMPKIALNILVAISRYASEQGVNLEELFAKHFSVKELSAKESTEEVFDYLKAVLQHICDFIEEVKKNKDNEVLEAAKKYVHEHYAEKLTLQSVAIAANAVPEHLDKLIYQQEKLTLTDYVSRVRIDEAKRLMEKTDMDELSIALRIGYDDAKYFASVFHKLEGISPLDYRHSLKPKLYNNIYIQ